MLKYNNNNNYEYMDYFIEMWNIDIFNILVKATCLNGLDYGRNETQN